jgi:hypothetical protein
MATGVAQKQGFMGILYHPTQPITVISIHFIVTSALPPASVFSWAVVWETDAVAERECSSLTNIWIRLTLRELVLISKATKGKLERVLDCFRIEKGNGT